MGYKEKTLKCVKNTGMCPRPWQSPGCYFFPGSLEALDGWTLGSLELPEMVLKVSVCEPFPLRKGSMAFTKGACDPYFRTIQLNNL